MPRHMLCPAEPVVPAHSREGLRSALALLVTALCTLALLAALWAMFAACDPPQGAWERGHWEGGTWVEGHWEGERLPMD